MQHVKMLKDTNKTVKESRGSKSRVTARVSGAASERARARSLPYSYEE